MQTKSKHDKLVGTAMAIIEHAIEPLMNTMAQNIADNPYKSRRQIIYELRKGMNGEAYYELEDKIMSIISNRYDK